MVVDEATGPLSSLLSSGCKASFRLQPLSLLILVTSQGGNSDMDADLSKSDGNPLLSRPANNIELTQLVDENSFLERPDTLEDGSKLEMNSFENGPKFLPFEFRALEACLESVCSCLESETGILEQEAYPALDELTSKISTLNLERVRQIKSRLVAISGRVQKVRDELEHLLDDDEDMAEMYLTNKLMQQHMDLTTSSSVHVARGQMEHKLPHSDAEEQSGFEALSGDGDSSTSGSTQSGTKGLDVEELEMLLDAYFIQIDGTLNKLSALREYVDDTKDYINIMLDDKQNQLLQMGVMLTTATLVVSLFVVVTGVLSINIRIELFDPDVAGLPHMSWTVGGCTSGCIFLYTVAIAWYKHKRIV